MEGCTVVTRATATRVRAGDGAPADLVITDLNMPILDGIELARLLRRQRGKIAGIPIIALSANLPDYDLPKR